MFSKRGQCYIDIILLLFQRPIGLHRPLFVLLLYQYSECGFNHVQTYLYWHYQLKYLVSIHKTRLLFTEVDYQNISGA